MSTPTIVKPNVVKTRSKKLRFACGKTATVRVSINYDLELIEQRQGGNMWKKKTHSASEIVKIINSATDIHPGVAVARVTKKDAVEWASSLANEEIWQQCFFVPNTPKDD
jgi:hypothetical protein